MKKQHLFTVTNENGWNTSILITGSGKIEMNDGHSLIVLSIKDIRRIVREYKKETKKI